MLPKLLQDHAIAIITRKNEFKMFFSKFEIFNFFASRCFFSAAEVFVLFLKKSKFYNSSRNLVTSFVDMHLTTLILFLSCFKDKLRRVVGSAFLWLSTYLPAKLVFQLSRILDFIVNMLLCVMTLAISPKISVIFRDFYLGCQKIRF